MTSTPSQRPRIAVIAVHGVADQKPSETVRTAAKMLARAAEWAQPSPELEPATPDDAPTRKLANLAPPGTYSAFEEHSLRIPVVRVPTPGRGGSSANGHHRRLKAAFAYKVQSKTVTARLDAGSAVRNGDMSLSYMTELLQPYQVSGEDAIYETLRIESTRTGSKADVDVYEMYWADLSRFVGNWMRWLIEFYQLLFDLCILGRKSLDFARAHCQPLGRTAQDARWMAWPVFAFSQITAERSLALFVPVLNLYLLAIALSLLPLLIPVGSIPLAVDWLIAVAATLASAFVIYFRRTWFSSTGRSWPQLLLVPLMILAAGGSLQFTDVVAQAPYLWLMLMWWPLPLITLLWAMSAYQKSRRGALPTAVFVGIPVTAIYAHLIVGQHDSAAEILGGLLHTSEWILLGLFAAWVCLYLGAFVMTLSGLVAPFSVPKGDERETARRAAWTANLTIVLPGILVLILTLTLWQCLIDLAAPPEAATTTTSAAATASDTPWLLAQLKASPLWQTPYQPCWGNPTCLKLLYPTDTHPDTIANIVHALFKQSQGPVYCIGLLLFILAVVLTVWTILPAAVAELQARHASSGRTPAERQSASGWLGESLSAGFRAMRLSGEIVRVEFIALIPIGGLLFGLLQAHLTKVQNFLESLNSLSFFVAGWLALALIASKGPFRALALGLRSALDISLDVLNWLRISPVTSNCRARICARFYSLLKHLEEWKSREDGQGYHAIVILSHSQGTVITADLLRYLNSQELSPNLPIYLFTMGCPLRQLYGLRFPNLYGWARKSGEKWPCGPQPEEVGVALWVNAYTSGDYVGRYLWYPDVIGSTDARWDLYPAGKTGDRKREFCVGAGAHTHYWDDSAPEIAIELDQLIGLASRSAAAAASSPPKAPELT